MGDLIASGRIVDLIIAAMVVEALALAAWRRATGRGIAAKDLACNFGAGIALLLALRAALAGANWPWVALALALALAAHLLDLRQRWPAR